MLTIATGAERVGGVPQPEVSEERAGPPLDGDGPAGPTGPKGCVDGPRILAVDAQSRVFTALGSFLCFPIRSLS